MRQPPAAGPRAVECTAMMARSPGVASWPKTTSSWASNSRMSKISMGPLAPARHRTLRRMAEGYARLSAPIVTKIALIGPLVKYSSQLSSDIEMDDADAGRPGPRRSEDPRARARARGALGGRGRRAIGDDHLHVLAAADAPRAERGHQKARGAARSREARALRAGVLAREARWSRARCAAALRAGGAGAPGNPRVLHADGRDGLPAANR